MRKLSRRSFTVLCGTALAAETLPSFIQYARAADTSHLTELTLTEVSARVHAGTVTSTELVHALLDRIAVLNPKVNCYITVMATEALAQATVLDAEAKAGKFRGTLHGIPIALKDNIDTAGGADDGGKPDVQGSRADGGCGHRRAAEESRCDHHGQAEPA